ncbi:hypothetical protein D3C72_1488800 [compost metagenome]
MSLAPRSSAFSSRGRSCESTRARIGNRRVGSLERAWAISLSPSKPSDVTLTIIRSTAPRATSSATTGSASTRGRCSTASSCATLAACRALSSTTRTRPPDPFSRATPAVSTPTRRPLSSRSRSSSMTIFSRVRLLTRAIRITSSSGLVRKSSAPASSPRIRSCRPSSAVTSTTGICRVFGSSLRRRQVSNPSMPGIMTSSRIRSGCSAMARLMAVSPSPQVRTS